MPVHFNKITKGSIEKLRGTFLPRARWKGPVEKFYSRVIAPIVAGSVNVPKEVQAAAEDILSDFNLARLTLSAERPVHRPATPEISAEQPVSEIVDAEELGVEAVEDDSAGPLTLAPEDLLDAPPSLPTSQTEPTSTPLVDLSYYSESAEFTLGEVNQNRNALSATEKEIGVVTAKRNSQLQKRTYINQLDSSSTPEADYAMRRLVKMQLFGEIVLGPNTIGDLDGEISSLGETLSKLESQAADIRAELGVLDTSLANLIGEGEHQVAQMRILLAEVSAFLEGKAVVPATPRQGLIELDLIDLTGFETFRDGIIAAANDKKNILAEKEQQVRETNETREAFLTSRGSFQAYLDNPGKITDPKMLISMLNLTLSGKIDLKDPISGLTANIETADNKLLELNRLIGSINNELGALDRELRDLAAEGEALVSQLLATMATIRETMGIKTVELPVLPKPPAILELHGLAQADDIFGLPPRSVVSPSLPEPADQKTLKDRLSGLRTKKRRPRKAAPPLISEASIPAKLDETTTVQIAPITPAAPELDETTTVVALPTTTPPPAAPVIEASDEATVVVSSDKSRYEDLGFALALIEAKNLRSILHRIQDEIELARTGLGNELAKAIKAALETNLTEEALKNKTIELIEDALGDLATSGGPLAVEAANADLAFSRGKERAITQRNS